MKALVASLLFSAFAFALSAEDAAFALESSSFKDGGPIPAKCAMAEAKGGQNISPELSWRNPPDGAKSFAVTCIDKHHLARNWVHWIVYEIPASASSLPEGADLSKKFILTLENSFGQRGWGGPLPPARQGEHQYVFTIYALNEARIESLHKFSAKERMSEKQFLAILKGKIISKASITGTFER